MKLRALFTFSSRVARVILLVGTLLISGIYLLGAYSGYIAPKTWILPSFLGLLFPGLLLAQILVSLFWLIALDKKRLILVGVVWLISLPQLLTYFPISRSAKILGDEDDAIRVLSYNVCAFGFKPHSKTSPNAILQYIKSSGADIVCLQEAMLNQNPWAGVVSKTLRSYLDKDYPYIQVNRVNRGGSTLALLSKYPITETKEIPIDSWVNGAIAYKVLIRGEETLIINVHLESFHLRRVDGEDYLRLASQGDAVRLKDAMGAKLAPTFRAHGIQANVIHQLIQSYGTERVIVCGDFNDTPLSYTRRKIADGLKDAFVERGNGFGFTFKTRPFIVRIDHILYGSAFRAISCEVDKTASESDHHPIEAVLSMSPAQE